MGEPLANLKQLTHLSRYWPEYWQRKPVVSIQIQAVKLRKNFDLFK